MLNLVRKGRVDIRESYPTDLDIESISPGGALLVAGSNMNMGN